MIRVKHSPILRADPEERPELHGRCEDDLPDKTRQHLPRHQARRRPLRVYARPRLCPPHCIHTSAQYINAGLWPDVLVTAIGMMMNRSMYKNCDLR